MHQSVFTKLLELLAYYIWIIRHNCW